MNRTEQTPQLTPEDAAQRIRVLEDENEYLRKRFEEVDLYFGRNLVVMKAAVIEWRATGDARNGMAWIYNTLCGPGELPPQEEKEAQEYFNRETEVIDRILAALYHWFRKYHRTHAAPDQTTTGGTSD
ncbi:hypothetical protein ACEOS0_004509 [Escherichia coli]